MRSRRLTRAGALALALSLSTAAIATAVVFQRGNLRITVQSLVQPFKLPRTKPAPIAVFVSGHVGTADGTIPPQLERMTVKVNRHGLLQSKGLPVCQIAKIQPASTERALANCKGALIGSGRFWAHIVLPDQGAYPTRGRILIFNGRTTCVSQNAPTGYAKGSRHSLSLSAGRVWPSSSRTQGGRRRERTVLVRDRSRPDRGHRDAPCHTRPALLAHIFTQDPFASSFVIAFAIRRIRAGTYGTQLSASLPQALGDWGYVDRIKLTLRRKYRYRGRELSYFNAACPAPRVFKRTLFPLALVSFGFAEGKEVSVKVTKTCAVAQ